MLVSNTQNYGVPAVSPVGTTVLLGSVAQSAIIGQNLNRRGIVFSNPSDVTIYVCPANQTAVIGQGTPILAGATVPFLGDGKLIFYTCGWNAIAASGSNKPLEVLELV